MNLYDRIVRVAPCGGAMRSPASFGIETLNRPQACEKLENATV